MSGKQFILSNDQIGDAIIAYAKDLFSLPSGKLDMQWQMELANGRFRLTSVVLHFVPDEGTETEKKAA